MNHASVLSSLGQLFDRHASDRIAFRPMSRSDGFPLFIATRHPGFNRFLLWSAPADTSQALLQVDKLMRQDALRTLLVRSICKKDTGQWIGYLLFKPFRDGIEMGLALHPQVWNTGAVMDVSSLVLQLMATADPAVPFYNRVTHANHRAQRICRSHGMERVDETVENHTTTGDPMSFEVYRLTHASRRPRGETPLQLY